MEGRGLPSYKGRPDMISASTRVHLVAFTHNGKCWLSKVATGRNKRGDIVLIPTWDDDPTQSQSVPLEHALIFRRRLKEESNVTVRFALSAGESADFIEERATDIPLNGRTPTPFKGVLVVPGNGNPHWFVRYPGTAIESTRGDSVEDAYNRCVERGLLQHAEKAPEEPPAPPLTAAQRGIPRIRPGSL
jgi:hypothetical protein